MSGKVSVSDRQAEAVDLSEYKAQMDDCLAENIALTEEEHKEISAAIEIRTYKAGTVLLEAGEIATECYLNLKGCVRQYYFIDGEEKTTFFYTEGQPIAPFASATKKVPSSHYLSCVEDTTLSVMTFERERELYKKYPKFESLCRIGVEEQLGQYQEMLAKYITSTPEERYLDLLESRPDLLNRVPQYQLASYLGITPESLSRIRKRIMLRPGVDLRANNLSLS